MHVQVVRQQLADRRAGAGLVDGVRVPRPKQQLVGLPASLRVGAEERTGLIRIESGKIRECEG
jgi:hypothetical protein